MDEALGEVIERDPAKTADLFNVMPAWRREPT
jgi:hypothetical protein